MSLACKKSARFIHAFRNDSPTPIFYHNHPKITKVVLNFPEFASACKKSAKKMIEKTEKTKNGFHHHEVKVKLYRARIKHLTNS